MRIWLKEGEDMAAEKADQAWLLIRDRVSFSAMASKLHPAHWDLAALVTAT
jgi:hypothetical protein